MLIYTKILLVIHFLPIFIGKYYKTNYMMIEYVNCVSISFYKAFTCAICFLSEFTTVAINLSYQRMLKQGTHYPITSV